MYNVLSYLVYTARNGITKEPADQFGGKVWKNVTSLSSKLSTNSKDKIKGIKWAICHHQDRSGRQQDQYAQELRKSFETKWCRKWDKGCEPLRKPIIMGLNYYDLASCRSTLRQSGCRVIVLIIPNNEEGSKLKADLTRYILCKTLPSNALTTGPGIGSRNQSEQEEKKSNDIALDLQFIRESTIKNGEVNIFEAVLIKTNAILYWLEPVLPSREFNYNRLWMIGIKILRKKGGAHAINISCNRAPMVGTVKYLKNHWNMIPSEKDVIPQNIMYKCCMDVLKSALEGVKKSNGDEELPLNIIILRSGGGDSLLKTIISKELAGFKKAFYDFGKQCKSLIKSVNKASSKWFPGIIFSVLQENVTDRFGIDPHKNGRIVDCNRALVVSQKITSSQFFDVFISLPTKQERNIYGRVVRLVTICDEYVTKHGERVNDRNRLHKKPKLMSDYIALIYSSIWGYALNIPFPKVPNLPSPIKYAEHYASWQYGNMTEQDRDVNELGIDIDNSKPKVTHIMPEKIATDNDVVMK